MKKQEHGEVKVESGKPITSAQNPKYPFGKMRIGDSFAVPLPDGYTFQRFMATLGCAWRAYRMREGNEEKQFVSRRVLATDEEPAAVRVWRVA